MELDEKKLNDMLIQSSMIGFSKACELLGVGDQYISMKAAAKMYGEGNVKRWMKQGLKAEKRGGSINSKIFIKTSDIILFNK